MERLTPMTQDTVLSIGAMMEEGYKESEIAVSLRLPLDFVKQRLDQLRREIEDYNKGILALSEVEYTILKESISEVGIHSPIIIGDHMMIDGRGRCHAARALGFTEVPVSRVIGLTEQQEYDLRITLNVARRHLSREQKQALVRHELDRDSGRSDRMVSVLCGVDHKTVGSIRERIREEELALGEPAAEVTDDDLDEFSERKVALNKPLGNFPKGSVSTTPDTEVRRGSDGRRFEVPISRSSTPTPPPPIPPKEVQEWTTVNDPLLGDLLCYLRCPHGQKLRLHSYNQRRGYILVEEPRDG